MCPSGATSLYVHCCFSELALNIQLSMLVWYKADLIIILFKINLFLPWYSWQIAELALYNNPSLAFSIFFSGILTLPLDLFNPLLERNHTTVCRTVLNMYSVQWWNPSTIWISHIQSQHYIQFVAPHPHTHNFW